MNNNNKKSNILKSNETDPHHLTGLRFRMRAQHMILTPDWGSDVGRLCLHSACSCSPTSTILSPLFYFNPNNLKNNGISSMFEMPTIFMVKKGLNPEEDLYPAGKKNGSGFPPPVFFSTNVGFIKYSPLRD